MEHEVMWILIYGLIISQCRGKEPRYKTCIGNYELSFFDEGKTFNEAKASCEAYDGRSYLVKIDSAEITEAIDSVIEIGDVYFVGAQTRWNGGNRIWMWLDDSKVYLPKEIGYQNWKRGQPNNVGGKENCILLGKGDSKQWIDSNCGETTPRELYNHICQKKVSINITINSTISNKKLCSASAGSCNVEVEWIRNNVTVSNITEQTVYQTTYPGSSMLRHENATIGDAGEYVCAAWLMGNVTGRMSKSIYIKVNGTPAITSIKAFPCNTSLLVFWKAHFHALGFPHRILVYASSDVGEKIIFVTPTKEDEYFTEITGLQPSTEYIIVACNDADECLNDQAANTTATTLGTIITVSHPRIQQTKEGDICIVSWGRTTNIYSEQFLITVYSSTTNNPGVNILESLFVNITESGFLYLIYPSPERVYDVAIQVPENDKYCSKPVKAVGSCLGKGPENISHSQTSVSTIILSVVVVVMFLIIASLVVLLVIMKRNKQPAHQSPMTMSPNKTTTSINQEYATVDAAYSSISDLQQSSSATVNTPYENLQANAKSPYTYEN